MRTTGEETTLLQSDQPIPLHIQLKRLIEQEIQTGKYTDKIPSERELMERFKVSRSTVRESINHLVREQVLEKVHGKGTFIRRPKTVSEWLNSLHSFTETVREMGMVPSAKLLKMKENVVDDEIAKILNDKQLFTFSRLRFADDIPIAIEQHFYRQTVGDALKQYDLNNSTIYELLENELRIALSEAEQTIRVAQITKRNAELLHITPNINVLCVERIITGIDGEVIEFYRSYFHPEHYELKLKTKRQISNLRGK